MARNQHHAALHFINWYTVEPPYKDIINPNFAMQNQVVNKTKKIHKQQVGVKSITSSGTRVYISKAPIKENQLYKRRTAVIESKSDKELQIRYDDNNDVLTYQSLDCGLKTHFISIEDFPAVYRKVEDINSFIGFRFDNLKKPKWVKGVLRPNYNKTGKDISFGLKKMNIEDIDTSIENVSVYERYELQVSFSCDTLDTAWWKSFFEKCLDEFKKNEINYVSIPYIYDVCSMEYEADITKIGFETVLDWMKNNPDWSMRVIFLCTSIETYEAYSKVCEEHTVKKEKD